MAFDDEVEKRCMKGRPFCKQAIIATKECAVKRWADPDKRDGFDDNGLYDSRKMRECIPIYCGGFMDKTAEGLKLINEEIEVSKKTMETLFNEVRALYGQVTPILKEGLAEIRTNRMSVTTEIQTTMQMFRDVRKFFLESAYQEEVSRLREFVGLCQELEALKKNGTLDAISDTILKLAIK